MVVDVEEAELLVPLPQDYEHTVCNKTLYCTDYIINCTLSMALYLLHCIVWCCFYYIVMYGAVPITLYCMVQYLLHCIVWWCCTYYIVLYGVVPITLYF